MYFSWSVAVNNKDLGVSMNQETNRARAVIYGNRRMSYAEKV